MGDDAGLAGEKGTATDMGHHGWVNGQPPATFGQDYERRRVAREQERLREQRARRDAARTAEDERYDAEQRAKRAEAERRRRERAEAEAAAVRARIERELRLGGCPEGQVTARADHAMAQWFANLALEAATWGDRQERELREYFASRGI